MPQLIIKGMNIETIKQLSKPLVDELTQIIGCPREYFTIEAVQSVFIQDGQEQPITPFVQVNWFDRGQAVQDQVAQAICRQAQRAGSPQVETFFVVLEESRYYENDRHY
ncbi:MULTISPECIES: DUF1904 family protein [Sporomusa]|uniref:DUF1904 domain-containing protein n=1 Tax=Sporomusa sphaeroides DSM 2875 TaxID=1337886 RepID=A0ABM9W5M2_9FIRM|nr:MULTISPECIES: DUF1904 family protein [Sporomusa]OLS55290.1 hypothetical protein SPSPH_33380 [Sporomusa sphaeroides DSM 2875]CVK20311.1 hypothetical protein SSPH_02979 [Sporomusa sphaeroides DSM 2875]HML33051.1 DUF1904 family protein [Sporomusa sphaeroides]